MLRGPGNLPAGWAEWCIVGAGPLALLNDIAAISFDQCVLIGAEIIDGLDD
jgi:hypothetical protein